MLEIWRRKSSGLAILLNKWLTQAYTFLIFVFCPFQLKKIHYNRAGHNFFNAVCKRVRSFLQKRKHHYLLMQCISFNIKIFSESYAAHVIESYLTKTWNKNVIKIIILLRNFISKNQHFFFFYINLNFKKTNLISIFNNFIRCCKLKKKIFFWLFY